MIDSTASGQRISSDLEFSGALNKAISHDQNKNFGLLLAMLQQNVLERTLLAKEPTDRQYNDDISQLNHYRSPDLHTEEHHWQQQNMLSRTINDDDLVNARLWSCLFPPPLSIHNDRNRIHSDVRSNISYDAQQRLDTVTHEPVASDPTKLYDILNTLSEV